MALRTILQIAVVITCALGIVACCECSEREYLIYNGTGEDLVISRLGGVDSEDRIIKPGTYVSIGADQLITLTKTKISKEFYIPNSFSIVAPQKYPVSFTYKNRIRYVVDDDLRLLVMPIPFKKIGKELYDDGKLDQSIPNLISDPKFDYQPVGFPIEARRENETSGDYESRIKTELRTKIDAFLTEREGE